MEKYHKCIQVYNKSNGLVSLTTSPNYIRLGLDKYKPLSLYEKMCGRYYISKKLKIYSEGLLYLWEKFEIGLNLNRAGDLLQSNVYEDNMYYFLIM